MAAGMEQGRRGTPEQSTEEILRAAEELLREAPLSALTVGAVMGRTRLGRSSFYVYFRDVDDLVARLSQRLEERLWEVTARWLEADEAADGIEEALGALVEVWAEHGPVLHAIAASATTNERIAQLWRHGLVERFIRAIARRIAQQVEAGVTPPVPAYETAAALTLMNERFLMDRFGPGSKATARDRRAARDALRAIWRGTLYPPSA